MSNQFTGFTHSNHHFDRLSYYFRNQQF